MGFHFAGFPLAYEIRNGLIEFFPHLSARGFHRLTARVARGIVADSHWNRTGGLLMASALRQGNPLLRLFEKDCRS